MLTVVTSTTLESESRVIEELECCDSIQLKVYPKKIRDSWSLTDFHRAVSEAEIWLTSNEHPVDKATLNSAPNLKMIALNCSGTNHVDREALKKAGIILCNTGSVSTEPVSEFIWAQILCLQRKLSIGSAALRKGLWNSGAEKSLSLAQARVGIIGYGAIGRRIVEKGAGLCRSFLIYRRFIEKNIQINSQLTLCPDLDEVLKSSDIIVVAVPLTEETEGLIGEREFSIMQPHALLVNSMRGPIIDEKALVRAIINHEIGGAALDVFNEEPLTPEHELLELSGNVLLTPHLAGLTEDAVEAAAFIAARNAICLSRGEELTNTVIY